MPVPQDREDAYFVPLKGLELDNSTQLFLGLVHMSDGAEGAQKRIYLASKYYEKFGVATECGFGRRPADTVKPLMDIHANVSGCI